MSVKSFMRKCTVTAAAVSCFVFLCTAQQNGGGRMVMSIGDIFAIADSASSSIRVFQTGVSAAEEALSAARSQRLPDISVSASVSYLGDGILWDRNFGNPQKIGIPHFGNNLAIEAQQVIYAGGAVSSGIEIARLEHQKAGLDLEQHRQDVRFMLVGYYLELYRQYNLLEVMRRL